MANKESVRESKYYSYLLINKAKRWFLIVSLFLFFVIFTSILFTNMVLEKNWIMAAVPISLLGIFILFLPQVEEWVYEPWQSKPRMYEYHSSNNK